MEEPDDPQILWRRFGTGDRRAFTALYQRHHEDVLRFCQALLRDPEDAKEAANSTWAALWKAPSAAERGIPLRPWLFRIAHNEAIDVLRRRRPHEQLDADMPGLRDTAADAELHDRLATLRADLLTLTDHQRTALVLREMSGLSHEDIADVLEISVGAAKQAIYEARQGLIEAEGGRSLACELVRRDLSTGDRRVLRGRRIRAHLRTCAGCRDFAAAVERQRRDLRVLIPLPAGLTLLGRFGGTAAEVTTGGGTTGAAALAAIGAKVAGPAASKVAVAAVAAVVGAGASGEIHAAPHEAERASASVAQRAARADQQASAVPAAPVRTAPHASPGPRRPTRSGPSPHAAAASARDKRASGPVDRKATKNAGATPTPSQVEKRVTAAPTGTPARPPAQPKQNATTARTGRRGVGSGPAKKPPRAPTPPRTKAPDRPGTPATAPSPRAPHGPSPSSAPTPTPAAPQGNASNPPPPDAAPNSSHVAPAGNTGSSPESSPTAAPAAGPAGVGPDPGKGGR